MRDLQSRIIWLAGFIDGEGTITVFTHYDKSTKFRRFTPIICVVNTEPNLINEVQKIIDECGCSSYIMERINDNPKHKNAYQLSTRKMAHVKIILEKIIPYLVGKKAQAELTLRFINSRISRKGTGQNNQQSPYNVEEMGISKTLYSLNRKGKSESSETICQTANADDIVRTA